MEESEELRVRRAVIFDLDGTLTLKAFDADKIRAEMGISQGPIWEAIQVMAPVQRAAAEEVLERHERTVAETAPLRSGAIETIGELRRRGFAVGILTRNARRWAQKTLDRLGISVDEMCCREDGAIKPDPQGVLALCAQFEASPSQCWMVGDYLFDIESGRRAGVRTVLLVDGDHPEYADQADYIISCLTELLDLVDSLSNT